MRWRIRRRSVSSLVSPGPARADAAAQPRERGSRSDESWQQVLQLRELHLQLAFARSGAPRKMSRMSWVRSTTFRSSASSRFLSCAGLSSLSKMTTSALSCRTRPRGIRLCRCRGKSRDRARPILHHSKDDLRARRRGETRKFVERVFGVEVTEWNPEEPDESRTLVPILRGRTRSRETFTAAILSRGPTGLPRPARAPARHHRRHDRRRRPPGARPHRGRRSIPGRSSATLCGDSAEATPDGFALVAVIQNPNACASSRATTSAGTRIATVVCPPSAARDTAGPAGTTMDNGPGQKASASRIASGPKSPPPAPDRCRQQ